MREGDGHVQESDTSSLQVLGTVGEPINPEAWKWYHRVSPHLHNIQTVTCIPRFKTSIFCLVYGDQELF